MSRLEFRAAVPDPRPASAWVMVATAATTLWITRQIAVWAVAAQAAAIAASLLLRRRPHPWQRSPVALNVGMVAVVGATIAVALEGSPSSVALAHFAALAQGLQLIDARPRKSEFLLVAMALFQVLLASALTDSLLFVPLLGSFVLATSWTLIVHTLRTEALEAGRPDAVPRALTPGLLWTTALASGASIALALALFLVLPRLPSTLAGRAGLDPSAAVVGFSDRVELGDLGRIRQDHSVVMRVETLEGQPPQRIDSYWRGLAFDRFDGRTWSVTPREKRLLARNAELGVGFSSTEDANLVQRIVREPVASGVLFRAGEIRRVRGPLGPLEGDANGGLYAPARAHARLRYTAVTHRRSPDEETLRRDRLAPPPGPPERFLSLPALDPAIAALAREVTRAARSDAERVRALEHHLRRTGRYSDTPPQLDTDTGVSPIESFLLGERAGHCEYFASAMVVMARSAGIPARLVNGFAGGERNRLGGFVEVTRADAHAWVEVHYAGAGWVRYDPTPPDLRLRGEAAGPWGHLRSLGSALELWWFQRVVDFDRADQLRALKAGWLAWRRVRGSLSGEAQRSGPTPRDWSLARQWILRVLITAPLALFAIWLASRLLRPRRPRSRMPRAYADALRILARRGLVRGETATAWDFVAQVRAVAPAAGAPLESLTRTYLEQRFGRRVVASQRGELRRLRCALRDPHGSSARISQQRSSG